MAAPNIVATTSIYGKSDSGALTTGSADLLTNGASSSKVLRINSLYISNIDGANACNVTITFYDASRAATRNLANVITVPAKSTLVVVSKDTMLNLEEGDKISGLASANGDLEYVISWDEIG
jgi:hypothetical protein